MTTITKEQFMKRFHEDTIFYNHIYNLITEVGGLNLWDSFDFDVFYNIYNDR